MSRSGAGVCAPGRLAALAALVLVLVVAWPRAALADTFTVTTTKDSGKGSLRKAILAANGRMGQDKIRFRIGGGGVKTIKPLTPLPVITSDALQINGYTQPGSASNTSAGGTNAVLKVQLNGSQAGATSGLVIGAGADGSRISGLAINRFQNAGIFVETGGCSISGNFIGTSATGITDLGNGGSGVAVGGDADNNTVGGEFINARNLISGNAGDGVRIDSLVAEGNAIQGNLIGTDATGRAALGNTGNGVVLTDGAPTSRVGGPSAGARNVISANGSDGVLVTASDAVVQGNFVGTDATGRADLGNAGSGIRLLSGGGHLIGGTEAGAGNTVSGNGAAGVEVSSTNNTIQGNRIGTSVGGNTALRNEDGVRIQAGTGNAVGGPAEGARNVISGNLGDGLAIGGSETTVQGNFIGTTADGSAALGNGLDGVDIRGAANTIGGTSGAATNVISANREEGVRIVGSAATGNEVLGNLIGTRADGSPGLGNTSVGVLILDAPGNTIGGTAPGAANTITDSSAAGVAVSGAGATGNGLFSNRIFGNGGLGIDLGTTGVTPNDPGDGDAGPNRLQNFPDILRATRGGSGALTVSGTLDSNPGQDFVVQCFLSTADASGHGEGSSLVAQTTVTTDSGGDADFTCTGTLSFLLPGQQVTATATRTGTNDTSEFADNAPITSVP